MMRELGGVFGIAVVVAVFAGAGSYASPQAFTDGFAPAIGVGAAAGARRRGRRRWRCRAAAQRRRSPLRVSGGRDNETGHGALQGQARARRPRTRRSSAPSTRSSQRTAARRAALRDVPARRRRRASSTSRRSRTSATRWPRSRRSRASRPTSRDRCDEPPVVTRAARGRRRTGSMTAEPASSTSSSTPATCARASAFYARAAAAGARADRRRRAYLALDLGGGFGGGIVECGTARPVWLPYVEVGDVDAVTDRARRGSARRSCSSRARARPAGAASSRRPRAARSRSGSPSVTAARAPRRARRRGRLRAARRAAPRRAARPLLPDARLGPGRRGRAAGGAARAWRGLRALRGPQLAALVAVHDRDQRLPEGDRAPAQARAADRLRPGRRPARRRCR